MRAEAQHFACQETLSMCFYVFQTKVRWGRRDNHGRHSVSSFKRKTRDDTRRSPLLRPIPLGYKRVRVLGTVEVIYCTHINGTCDRKGETGGKIRTSSQATASLMGWRSMMQDDTSHNLYGRKEKGRIDLPRTHDSEQKRHFSRIQRVASRRARGNNAC